MKFSRSEDPYISTANFPEERGRRAIRHKTYPADITTNSIGATQKCQEGRRVAKSGATRGYAKTRCTPD